MIVKVKINIYNDSVIAIFGDFSVFEDFCYKHMHPRDAQESIQGAIGASGFCMDSSIGILIWMPSPTDHYILYHECLHASISILERIGAPISYDNQESIAYLQGFIAEQLLLAYDKGLTKIKKHQDKELEPTTSKKKPAQTVKETKNVATTQCRIWRC